MDYIDIFTNHFLSKEKSASKNTIKNYVADVKHFVIWYEKSLKTNFEPKRVTSDIISLYEKSMGAIVDGDKIDIQTKLSISSIKRHLSSLRKFFSVLKSDGRIDSNPFDNLTSPINTNPTDYWHIRSFVDYLIANKVSKITVRSYASDIASFAKWYEQAILPSLQNPFTSNGGFYLITQSVLNEYKKRLLEIQNAAPRTINRKLSSIRRYLEFAALNGFIDATELSLDPIAESSEKELLKTESTVRLDDLKSDDDLSFIKSNFPPLALLQLLLIFPYLKLEDKLADKIANFITGKPAQGLQTIPTNLSKGISAKNGLRTSEQSVAAILGVKGVSTAFFEPTTVPLNDKSLHKRIIHKIRYTRPEWYRKYHSHVFVHYIHFALLVFFATGVGVSIYNSMLSKNLQNVAAKSADSNKSITFQARLTNRNGTAITEPTNVRFGLYDNPTSSGSALLWQEVNMVNPNRLGYFSVTLGNDTDIPENLLSGQSPIYIGITVKSSDELSPRQRLPNSSYALNTEFVQGMSPITSLDASDPKVNTLLALDSSGNLTIGGDNNPSPIFQATDGQFTLSGKVLRLETITGSNTNVVIAPDGNGMIDLHKGIINSTTFGGQNSGSVEVNDKFAVVATESAVAAFIVNNATFGGDIFTASSSGSPRFTIQNDGTLVSSIYKGQNGVLFGNLNTGIIAEVVTSSVGQCLKSGISSPTWGDCAPVSPTEWNVEGQSMYPKSTNLNLLIGGTSPSVAKFAFINVDSGVPTASISARSSNNSTFLTGDGNLATTNKMNLNLGGKTTGNVNILNGSGDTFVNFNSSNSRVGIGTLTPSQILDIEGNSATIDLNATGGTNALLSLQDNGQTTGKLFFDHASQNLAIENTIQFKDLLFLTSNGRWLFKDQNATSNSDKLKISSYSNEPTAQINGETTSPALLINQDGSGNLMEAKFEDQTKFYVNSNGDVGYWGALIPEGSDLAEYFKKANLYEDFKPGQLVCMTSTGITRCDNTTSTNGLIGVVSDNAFLTAGGNKKDDPNYVLVGMLGQLGVRFEGEIKKGDPLTISSSPGIAKKANSKTNIIGFALQDSNTTDNRIQTVIQPTYYDPSMISDDAYNNLVIYKEDGIYTVTTAMDELVNNAGVFSKAVIGNLNAGFIKTQEIAAKNLTSQSGRIQSLITDSLNISGQNLTIAGQNISDFIVSVVIEGVENGKIVASSINSQLKLNVLSPLADTSAPSIAFENSQIAIVNPQSQKVAWFDNNGNASFSGTLSSNNIETNDASISGNLTANSANFQTSNSQYLTSADASVSGTLRTGRLVASSIDGLDDKIATLASILNGTYPATQNEDLYKMFSNIVNSTTITADFGIFEQGITSMGPITASDITAVDTLGVGSNLTISNNAINTLGAELALQSLRQADISFQGGLIRMDTDGNMKIAGSLNVLDKIEAVFGIFTGTITSPALATSLITPLPGGDLTIGLLDKSSSESSRFLVKNNQNEEVLSINNKGEIASSGSATFSKLNFNLVGEAYASSLTEATSTGSAGFATLRSGQPELTIKNPNVTQKSLIYITPIGDTDNKILYLLRQNPKSDNSEASFTVGLSGTASTKNLQFNWLIIN